jgi:hypothetical protein
MLSKNRWVAIASVGVLSLSILSNAHALETANGIYLGGQTGWGMLHQDGFGSGSDTNSSGIAGRMFLGAKFLPNLALEAGYTKFSNMNSYLNSNVTGTTLSLNIQAYSVDVVVKGIIPLANGFDVYGKLGAAYLNEVDSGSIELGQIPAALNVTGTAQVRILPTMGLGLSYTFTRYLLADISWMHIQNTSDNNNLNNTDFFGIGLTYTFN